MSYLCQRNHKVVSVKLHVKEGITVPSFLFVTMNENQPFSQLFAHFTPDINTAISFTQFYSWAVSKQSPALLDSLNTWLDKFQKEKEYQKIYRKYYGDK